MGAEPLHGKHVFVGFTAPSQFCGLHTNLTTFARIENGAAEGLHHNHKLDRRTSHRWSDDRVCRCWTAAYGALEQGNKVDICGVQESHAEAVRGELGVSFPADWAEG